MADIFSVAPANIQILANMQILATQNGY